MYRDCIPHEIALDSGDYYVEETECLTPKPQYVDKRYMKRVNKIYDKAIERHCVGIVLRKLDIASRRIRIFLYYDLTRQVIKDDKDIYFPLKRLRFNTQKDHTIMDYIENQIITINSDQDCWYNIGFYAGNDSFGIYLPYALIYRSCNDGGDDVVISDDASVSDDVVISDDGNGDNGDDGDADDNVIIDDGDMKEEIVRVVRGRGLFLGRKLKAYCEEEDYDLKEDLIKCAIMPKSEHKYISTNGCIGE